MGDGAGVTVAVCTRNRPALLGRALAALRGRCEPVLEILVVDNAAPGEQEVRDRANAFGCRYVREPVPGIAHARNRALTTARSEVVSFLDDDCVPDPCWSAAITRAFCSRAVGGCTGPVRALSLRAPAQRLLEQRGGFTRGEVRQVFTARSHRAQSRTYPVQPWRFGTGANMAFRRRGLLDAGGFDTALVAGEDIDALYRMVATGWHLIYEPAASVVHEHPTSRAQVYRRLYRWGRAYGAFLAKTALGSSPYRSAAMGEIAGVFSYHLRERLLAAIRGRPADLPPHLVLLEVAGLIIGLVQYATTTQVSGRRTDGRAHGSKDRSSPSQRCAGDRPLRRDGAPQGPSCPGPSHRRAASRPGGRARGLSPARRGAASLRIDCPTEGGVAHDVAALGA